MAKLVMDKISHITATSPHLCSSNTLNHTTTIKSTHNINNTTKLPNRLVCLTVLINMAIFPDFAPSATSNTKQFLGDCREIPNLRRCHSLISQVLCQGLLASTAHCRRKPASRHFINNGEQCEAQPSCRLWSYRYDASISAVKQDPIERGQINIETGIGYWGPLLPVAQIFGPKF